MNAHKMAPRTSKGLQERAWDAPTKGLVWTAGYEGTFVPIMTMFPLPGGNVLRGTHNVPSGGLRVATLYLNVPLRAASLNLNLPLGSPEPTARNIAPEKLARISGGRAISRLRLDIRASMSGVVF